ncbi:hypothetical protein QYE76_019440, partial [Lolium multiflorum]
YIFSREDRTWCSGFDHGVPTINFNQFLEKEKLKSNGSNFTDWFRHVRIFLIGGNLQYVLEAPLGPPPPPAVSEDVKNVYETRLQELCDELQHANMNKELPELFSMLKSAEVEIRKENQVLMVNKTTSFKKQGKPKKGNFKKGGKKVAAPPEKPKAGPKPDTVCYYCKEKGHWKRNCPNMADLKSGLVKKKGIFDIHVIDVYLTVPNDVPVQPIPIREEENDDDHETSNEEATEPRRSTRERTTPDWYDPCLNVMIVDNNDEDPATYEEAMMSPDSNKWQEAMKSEMGSIYDNQVWTLVDLPDSRKAVENKWIFKRKTDADGNITVYKARLVAKGFRQIQGVNYDETFSPVAKLKSVRILLAIAAFFDYEIWQMDVKTVFLNGDIEEELYMVQPKCFVDPKNADKSGYVFILNGAAVSWMSSKQCTVARSSTESEYIVASEASSEAVWIKSFIVELGVVPSALDPLVIYWHNMGAIANAQEPRSHKKLKHIKLRFHSIREYIEDGEVKICKVHTDLNVQIR